MNGTNLPAADLNKPAATFEGEPSLETYSHNFETGKFTDGAVPKSFETASRPAEMKPWPLRSNRTAWADPGVNVFGWHGTLAQIAGLVGRGRWTGSRCSK